MHTAFTVSAVYILCCHATRTANDAARTQAVAGVLIAPLATFDITTAAAT
ncbi:hypothetical protein [Glaciimonas soli]|nr:hypothetical protein [Glaciimonas soli]